MDLEGEIAELKLYRDRAERQLKRVEVECKLLKTQIDNLRNEQNSLRGDKQYLNQLCQNIEVELAGLLVLLAGIDQRLRELSPDDVRLEDIQEVARVLKEIINSMRK